LKILITGASGLYGSKLAELARTKDYIVYSGYNQHKPAYGTPIKFEISDKKSVETAFRKTKPHVVVHAAALTNVDECENNKELAWKTNVDGTRNIIEAAKQHRAFPLLISTDYVFNGKKGLYKETDQTDPINYYGLTKLKAEEQVKELVDQHCIARTSVIYGSTPATGKINFALWLINKLKNNQQAKIVIDKWNSPTLNTNLASMTTEIIERKLTGIFHLSGATRISRLDFAKQIANTFHLNSNLIKPTKPTDFGWKAKRPKDSSLNTTKAQQTLENKPLQIKQALERLKQEITFKS